MKAWLFRILVLVLLVVVGGWLWQIFFPSLEEVVRKRTAALAETASFEVNEAPVAKIAHLHKLKSFFTPEAEIMIDVAGHSQITLRGRDDVVAAAMGARSAARSLKVEFVDIQVTVAPDRLSAVAVLTVKATVTGEPNPIVEELKIHWKRVEKDWQISRLETVKTLAGVRPRGRALGEALEKPQVFVAAYFESLRIVDTICARS